MNEKEAIKFLQSRVDLIKNDYPADQKGEIQEYYQSVFHQETHLSDFQTIPAS